MGGPWQEAIPLSEVRVAKPSWSQWPHRCLLMQGPFKLVLQLSQDILVRWCPAAWVLYKQRPPSRYLETKEPKQYKELKCSWNPLSQDILVRWWPAARVLYKHHPPSRSLETMEPRQCKELKRLWNPLFQDILVRWCPAALVLYKQ